MCPVKCVKHVPGLYGQRLRGGHRGVGISRRPACRHVPKLVQVPLQVGVQQRLLPRRGRVFGITGGGLGRLDLLQERRQIERRGELPRLGLRQIVARGQDRDTCGVVLKVWKLSGLFDGGRRIGA